VTAAVPLRLLPALLGAVAITLAVFLLMQGLIARGQGGEVQLTVYEDVQILRPEPEHETAPKTPDAPAEPRQEPVMDALQIAPPVPTAAQTLAVPALDLAPGDVAIPAVGDAWRVPLGEGDLNVFGAVQDAQGYIEVVPYDTRRPNVPRVAWENRISGWVLVAFTVTPDGHTRNVRVLDARPRGVFEEKVIAAVEDWSYSLTFKGRDHTDLVLTQRVEVRWQDYPGNLPNVD
jgi:TonB family protein